MTRESIDFADALVDPAAWFDRPADVVGAPDLSSDQKAAILGQWEADARELLVATDENMGGGEPALLDEVLEALHALGQKRDSETGSTTMHGHAAVH